MSERMAYIGRWATCDCLVGATVDEPDHAKYVARDVADWIRRGYRIEHVPCETVRTMDWRCPEHPKGTPYPWDLEKKGKRAAGQQGLGL